jgi:pimeloyl-ACP methyl ester carboxylesterase
MTRTAPIQHSFPGTNGALCWFEWCADVAEGAAPRATLLLLHATGFHARLWDQVVAHLPADVRIIAPDLRGHGRSYRPASMLHWAPNASDVAELLDTLEISGPLLAVGHSMGGFCVGWLAAHAPTRFTRALLIDPVLLAPQLYASLANMAVGDPSDHPVGRRRNSWANAAEMMAHFADRPPYQSWAPHVLQDYCTWGLLPAADGEGLELACPPALEASNYMGTQFNDHSDWLSKITCPVTVVRAKQGERSGGIDFSISPTWPGLAAALANGRDVDWSDLSHFIPMEAPERTAALICAELALAEQV